MTFSRSLKMNFAGLTSALREVANDGILVSAMTIEIAFISTSRVTFAAVANVSVEIAGVTVGVTVDTDL